jgi:hypothetical protein
MATCACAQRFRKCNVTPGELKIKADTEGNGAILRLKRRQQKIIPTCAAVDRPRSSAHALRDEFTDVSVNPM